MENIKIMKPLIKVLLLATIITCYFVNLIAMFDIKPLDILISNILIWVLIIIIPLVVLFIDWLIDKDSDD